MTATKQARNRGPFWQADGPAASCYRSPMAIFKPLPLMWLLVFGCVTGWAGSAEAQDRGELAGRWAIVRELSEFPREVGFSADWAMPVGGVDNSASGSGRARRGSAPTSASPFSTRRESPDDARRVQVLTAEVRTPPARLTIDDTAAAVTVTADRGRSRTFHPDGREESLPLVDEVPVGVTAKREPGRLVVTYRVEEGRDLRYIYSRQVNPSRLIVEVQFLERGVGDMVRRVYEPALADSIAETAAAAFGPSARAGGAAAAPPAAEPAQKPQGAPTGAVPPPGQEAPAPPSFNQEPDAELKGLSVLGLVVEDLGTQSAACSLKQTAIESAVEKKLRDAGFTVKKNSDEDTYVYVNVITSSVSAGLCVSRYDVFIHSHTTARLSYQDRPVLVEVVLMQKGGMAGGGPTAHAEGVMRGIQEYVDQFARRIREANK